jgi:Uma2 family endonuclease
MSTIVETIEYPESDGRPMGETDLHRDWMFRILEILRYRYRNQRVYIASDLLLYYEQGNPKKFIVPDDFIVLDCDPGRRRTFKTWEECRVPDVVFEVTSRSSKHKDSVKKPRIYEQLGVQEYFVYDPTCDYLKPGLRGFRLLDGGYAPIESVNGLFECKTLKLGLRLNDTELQFFDLASGAIALDTAEAEREAKEVELARNQELMKEIEQLKRLLASKES